MNHTYCYFKNPDCKVCTKKEAQKAEKLIIAEAKVKIHNAYFEELKPFIVAYNKAIKEVQGKPINPWDDKEILHKFGLMNEYFSWDYELQKLNRQLK